MTQDELYATLNELGVAEVRKGNKDFRALCPFHDERNASWGIAFEEPHLFGCFSCGAKGNIITLLMRLGNMPKEEAEKFAKCRSQVRSFSIYTQPKTLRLKEDNVRNRAYLEIFENAAKVKAAREYMLGRLGVTREFLTFFDLRYDKKQDRIVFPWRHRKNFYGATGRDITHLNELKTLPYFGLVKERMFYLPYCKVMPRMFVVEGEMDALSIARCYGGIAALGNGTLSENRFQWLHKKGCREVVTMFDNNKRGRALTREMKEMGRRLGFNVSTVVYDTDDPAMLSVQAVDNLVDPMKAKVFTFNNPVSR